MEKRSSWAIPPPASIQISEQRIHARFYLKNGPFGFVPLPFGMVGRIENVSLGGISFLYFASRDRTKNLSTLDISSRDCRVFLDSIPVTTVWDHPRTDDFFVDRAPIRHCGMRFRLLTDRQETDLQCFIENCADPTALACRP